MNSSRWGRWTPCVLAAAAVFSTLEASESPASPSWRATVLGKLEATEYQYGRQDDGSWAAPNRVQGLRSFVGADASLRLVPRAEVADPWELRLDFAGLGRGSALVPGGPVTVSAQGSRVERVGAGLTEWFVNAPAGIEHGFRIDAPPDAGPRLEPLVLEIRVSGALDARLSSNGTELAFTVASGRQVLRYDSLAVYDARGDRLDASFRYQGDRLQIVVDDRGAMYPVLVDPLVSVPDWSDTSDQADARFGVSVVGAGDLDHDGYDDVLVGAERYDNGQSDEGAVFVYLGGPGGPDTDWIWYAEGNQAGARFGHSLAGGNVNKDLYDDAIMGAARWDNGQTDEGGVFVFHGSPNALNPLLLRPVGNPSNADWHAESDQVVSEFGESVSTGDVNGDGADDLIIGAYQYTNGQSAEGSAFIFHGSNGAGLGLPGNTRPVGTPANANWRGESNQVFSYYGYSVAIVGDVNGDLREDVVVGAPDFESNFSLEGRGYLYLGHATAMSTTPVWTRDGGLDDAGFGVSVAGAGDVNADGKADVIIGADNYTSGQIFEGAAFVFHGKTGGLLGSTPEWTAELNQGDAFVGSSVASAGDVNSDGYADVLVGAIGFDDGEIDEGAVLLYLGSPNGLPLEPANVYEIDQDGAELGGSVDGAGDVNGDGFDDIVAGAEFFSLPQSQEGGAFLYLGCADGDRDGICSAADNCPQIVNPEQDDTDADGVGDVCDACEDLDADGVCDAPRVLIEGSGPGEQVLVQYGSPMRWLANTFVIPPVNWMTESYDDSNPPWQSGLYGVGYQEPPAGAPVGASDLLVTTNPPSFGTLSVYSRAEFLIPAGTNIETLFIGCDYDDGYVAWINGVEVYRSAEMPSTAGVPAYNTDPDGHESSNAATPVYEPLHNISFSGIPALHTGVNVLAIGVWNDGGGSSSDLVLVPRLSINRPVTNSVRYLANSAAPNPPVNGTWVLTSFNDDAWAPGNYGIGYEAASGAADLINTDVPSTARSIFTRARFNLAVSSVQSVFLGLDYDDGVVAWINGQEIYRTPAFPGSPGSVPAWSDDPPAHESSNGAEPNYGTLINVTTAALPALDDGENLFTVGVWNDSPGGLDDLVVVPRLSINETGIDNCPGVVNPDQGDVDGDGDGDACDPDIDNDGDLNGSDNCPTMPNADQLNSDADTAGNVCDPCPYDAPNDVDSDRYCPGNGANPPMLGAHDNCPATYNPGQQDQNLDGEGDACDPDIDGDGDLNINDNCVTTPNPAQTNSDADAFGDDCDCSDAAGGVWQTPGPITDLKIARSDLCVNYKCSQSLGACGSDLDCLHDECTNFTCDESLAACDTNADCLQDECADFECRWGGNACVNNSNCSADFCANKTCTVSFDECATDSDCGGDVCSDKECIESLVPCNSSSDCPGSETDICVGTCSVGGNLCVSNVACTQDKCRGACSIGGNTCVNNAVCTQDVCEGTCTIGGETCINDSVCDEPQTDTCVGHCSIGPNSCFLDSECTLAQTDLCKGTCSLSDSICVTDTICTDPAVDTLRWSQPAAPGALAVWYDTLRSLDETDFGAAATCVEIDGSNRETEDVALPPPNGIRFYLVRIENACPVAGSNMGSSSFGPRTGRSCP